MAVSFSVGSFVLFKDFATESDCSAENDFSIQVFQGDLQSAVASFLRERRSASDSDSDSEDAVDGAALSDSDSDSAGADAGDESNDESNGVTEGQDNSAEATTAAPAPAPLADDFVNWIPNNIKSSIVNIPPERKRRSASDSSDAGEDSSDANETNDSSDSDDVTTTADPAPVADDFVNWIPNNVKSSIVNVPPIARKRRSTADSTPDRKRRSTGESRAVDVPERKRRSAGESSDTDSSDPDEVTTAAPAPVADDFVNWIPNNIKSSIVQ